MLNVNLEFAVEETRDNHKIIKVNYGGKKIYIGSKYNMSACINEFNESILNDIKKEDILLIYGFSTGDYIKSLAYNAKNNRIIIFEPNSNMKQYINDMEWLRRLNNVEILCGEGKEIEDYIKNSLSIFDFNNIKIKAFANYNKIYKDEFYNFNNTIYEMLKSSIVNSNTQIVFSDTWINAILENIPYIIEGNPIDDYKGKFKGKPAIIVSAGPSLEKNICDLKDLDNEMLIISGGRTLKPLLNIDLMPHILTVVDAGEISYGLVEDYIDRVNIPLLFYDKTNAQVVSSHKGKKLFALQSEFARKIIDRDVKDLIAGGSVAHTMVMGAIELGCNPIIFIGQDLAYTDDKFHADIARYDKSITNEKAAVQSTHVFVDAIDGGKVRTNTELNDFRKELEYIISKNKEITFINATEGGARIKGTQEMTLKECINKYAKEKLDCSFEDIKVNSEQNKVNSLKILKQFKESCEKIILSAKNAKKLTKDLEKTYYMKDTNRINLILSKLDNIDKNIKEETSKFDEINHLLYPITYVSMIRSSKAKSNQDILKINSNLYKSILSELEKIKPNIDKAIKKLS